MATDIDLCSNALLLIGDDVITSFTDAGAGAKVASNLYESSYENILSLHRWRFAVGKIQLSQLVSTPVNQFKYAYQLPADLLTMIRTYPDSDYEIYEDKLYSNHSSVEIDYVFTPDESKLPAYFIKLMEFYLASQFAIPVTDNTSKAEQYNAMFEEQLKRARFLDSQGRPGDPVTSSPLVDVRG